MVWRQTDCSTEPSTEDPAIVDLYGEFGDLLASIVLPQTGDNGAAIVELEAVPGVWSMIVRLFGSAAIDDIVLEKGECGDSATTTTLADTTTTTSTSTTLAPETTTTTFPELETTTTSTTMYDDEPLP